MGESFEDCAKREVLEETGIYLEAAQFAYAVSICFWFWGWKKEFAVLCTSLRMCVGREGGAVGVRVRVCVFLYVCTRVVDETGSSIVLCVCVCVCLRIYWTRT